MVMVSPLQNVECGCGCSRMTEDEWERWALEQEASNFGDDEE